MKLINSKKGMQQMWWIIAAAIIAILIIIFIMIWFKESGGKAFGSVDTQIDTLGDCDKDNVADLFDKCPCMVGDPGSTVDGCPKGQNATKCGEPGSPSKEDSKCK